MKRVGGLLPALLVLAGCAAGPTYQRPEVKLPERFDGATAAVQAVAAAPIETSWWSLYNDPILDSLVESALKNNADLRAAVARVDEASAALREVNSALVPQVDLGASATRSRSSTLLGQQVAPGGPVGNSFRAALSTSFEIDLWGRLRSVSDAARAQLLASQYARDTVRLALAGTVAQTYFALRALDAQIVVTEAELRARDDSVKLIESRVRGGTSSSLEQAQARAALAATAAQQPELKRQRALLEHQLGALAGRSGFPIAHGDFGSLPLPALPPPGLPSALLERRPDVQQAEQQLVAANAQVGAARAAMFPTLSLTGSYGGQSSELSNLLNGGARIWSIGPSLLMPVFDAGRNVARTDQARARAEQAAALYQKAAEAAFRETADALVTVEHATDQELQLRAQLDATREALRVASRRFEAGYSSYLEVLDAQRSSNDAQLSIIRVRQSRLNAGVDLVKALGGGWRAP